MPPRVERTTIMGSGSDNKPTTGNKRNKGNREDQKVMQIGDLMTPLDTFVNPADRLSDVVRVMHANRWSCVLISADGTPGGILTERDIVGFFDQCMNGHALIDCSVGQVMTKDPLCLDAAMPLYDALMLARSHHVRHFPCVNDEDRLVGIVTQTDIVNAYVALIEKSTDLQQENEELKLLLNEDAMLKIGNRRAMEVELAFTEASSRRYQKPYAVALLDVDFFKQYNDYYGHQMGDKTLLAFAETIKGQMRDEDRVFRYGGEELLLLMPDTSSEDAMVVAERARRSVEEMMLPHVDSFYGVVTLSVGVARGQDEPWQELVKRADIALYEAKDTGRNRVVLH